MGIFNKTIPQALVGYDMIIANSYPMHSWNNYIVNYHLMQFFFLFIGREATTWPANNCLQIVVCSCTVSPNCVWLQIILCWWCVNAIALAWKWQITNLFMYQRYSLRKQTHDRMIKTIIIINSVIAKYSDLSVSYRSILIFCLRLWLRQQITIFCSTSSNC